VSEDLISRHAANTQEGQVAEVERVLATGGWAVVDNTNPRTADRLPLIELARKHGARTAAYFFAPQVGDSIRRNDARDPRVPKVAIFTTMKKLQPPDYVEGFDEIHDVRIAEDGSFSSTLRAK